MSATRSARRRRTRWWFVFYTVVLLGIVAVCVATSQWSVAVTTLLVAVAFALLTRGLWRRR